MGVIIKSIYNQLKQNDALFTLIFINVAVFLLLSVVKVISLLFDLQFLDIYPFIAVSSNIRIVLIHIWTICTYMFVHYDLFHILFNMLMLYWFGKIFMMYFTPKHLIALYILGGLAGALFFIFAFNTIPYFVQLGDVSMVGASASVTAIIFASAFYNRNFEVGLLFLGRVKIVYIALAIFILDFIALGNSSNQGGHIAHIGGALLGYIFAVQYLKGKDLTKGFNRMIDFFVNLFNRNTSMKVKYRKPESDFDYNQRKHNDAEEIDKILDKIKQSGYKSLTDKEKKRLFDASNK